MKILKIIFCIPLAIINYFKKGFNTLSLFLSRGFYFYLEKLFVLIGKLIPFKLIHRLTNHFSKMREKPDHIVFIIVCFLFALYIFDTFHVDTTSYTQSAFNGNIKPTTDTPKKTNKNALLSTDLNLYRFYSKYSIEDINFDELKKRNNHTNSWIIVENTNINYPIVQTKDNDYYLNHSYDRSYTTTGWTFMDYRNNELNDKNTIFYGHNLLNNTAFGSLTQLFKDGMQNSKIIVLTDEGKKYTYQIFSGYTIDPETYYLQTAFNNDTDYNEFLYTLKKRSTIITDLDVNVNDKIITLSTCTSDNKGRTVIHAKLLSIN